ncbi:MAG: hypothetical protein G01um101429_265 [Parcubacteria group bacterium Gr01-1014_29]|nr:MAG: hypothetical protein G01um101429_265 [Parcubacteria group bacterium Gr01-1014_29]
MVMTKVSEKTKRSYGRVKGQGYKSVKVPVIDVKKYGGLQVAIVNGKIIAEGRTWEEVLQNTQEKFPDTPLSEIRVFSVPKSLHVIYYA